MNRLFQNSTNNGRTGYELTSAAPNGSLRTVYNVTKGRKSIRPGMARLASGQQGVVFLASTDAAGKRKIIIKVSPTDKAFSSANQAARAEYNIQKALYKVAPRHIPKPIKFFEQNLFVPVSAFTSRRTNIFNYSKQMVMYTEYAHGGTLKSWLRKMGDRITDKVMADLIRQVIGTLKTIHTKYPEFRHNDLHLGNILVDDTGKKVRFLLTDFGLSRLTKHGSNPAINSGSYRNSGISNLTSSKYDTHYFLNALDSEIKGGLPLEATAVQTRTRCPRTASRTVHQMPVCRHSLKFSGTRFFPGNRIVAYARLQSCLRP
jgi:serine/threonine protein kinase